MSVHDENHSGSITAFDPTASGPATKVGPFEKAELDRQIYGYTRKDGPFALTVGIAQTNQVGVNENTVTKVDKDGAYAQGEVKLGPLKGSVEGQIGKVDVRTTAPGLSDMSTGIYQSLKAEVRVPVRRKEANLTVLGIQGKGEVSGFLGGNVIAGGTDLSYEKHTTEPDGTTTKEVGTTDQDDVTGHFIGGFEGKGSIGRVGAGVKSQVELGFSYVTQHREATIANSGRPHHQTTEVSNTEVLAGEVLGYADVKVEVNRGPAGVNRYARSYAYNFYEAEKTRRTEYVGDREVGRSTSDTTTYSMPYIGTVYNTEAKDSYALDEKGKIVSRNYSNRVDGVFNDTEERSGRVVIDGIVYESQWSKTEGIFEDETKNSYTTLNPDGTSSREEVTFQDGWLTDTTTTKNSTRSHDGQETVKETIQVDDLFSTTITKRTTTTRPGGKVTTTIPM
jgi:hypothetical protein